MKRSNPFLDLPLTPGRVFYMAFCTIVYIGQLVYGSFLGFFLFTLGKKTDEKRLWYHQAIWRLFSYDLEKSSWWTTEVYNPYRETFKRGSIIICNHQSMLDTLCLISLSPRILIVTHDKVWNNPLVAAVLRYADFFSVSDTEWDGRIEYCRSFIEQGYSIVIFPEGVRSREGNIQRFHKGAFYLAEQLQADILPVFIHGAAHVLPAGTHFLNRGSFYVEIGRRVSPDNADFGVGYVERCKQMHRFYLNRFEGIRYKRETLPYFQTMVTDLYASIGLRQEAISVFQGKHKDDWYVLTLVDALVHPGKLYCIPRSSSLRKLYDKYTHLPENIMFV